ncbi:MAG TPA: hypothetical protein DIW77_19940 [Chromatiaceae bacterium]|nr:hypothetical protein [Chromatiaceae bacterium]
MNLHLQGYEMMRVLPNTCTPITSFRLGLGRNYEQGQARDLAHARRLQNLWQAKVATEQAARDAEIQEIIRKLQQRCILNFIK